MYEKKERNASILKSTCFYAGQTAGCSAISSNRHENRKPTEQAGQWRDSNRPYAMLTALYVYISIRIYVFTGADQTRPARDRRSSS